MGRGLGQQQRRILDQLQAADDDMPLHLLVDEPDDVNEMNKARSAVRGLERRGLVTTYRYADPDRQIDTTVITANLGTGNGFNYGPETVTRAWHGMWVSLIRGR